MNLPTSSQPLFHTLLLPFLAPTFAELLLHAEPCAGSETTGMKPTIPVPQQKEEQPSGISTVTEGSPGDCGDTGMAPT